MYAIKENNWCVNGVKLKTFARNAKHGKADLDVETGTTGFRGYVPREESARTIISLDINRGDFFIDPTFNDDGRCVGVDIACCGDQTLHSLLDAVNFVRRVLLDQCGVI